MLRKGSGMARSLLLWVIISINAEISIAQLKVDTYPANSVPVGNVIDNFLSSGIFTRELGDLSVGTGYYHLVIGVDFETLENGLKRMKSFSKDFFMNFVNHTNTSYNTSVTYIKKMQRELLLKANLTVSKVNNAIEKLETRYLLLAESYKAPRLSDERYRRGLIDGIGWISKKLFGTALDSDVESLKNHLIQTETGMIKVLHNNENLVSLVHLQAEQIDIVEKQQQLLFNSTRKINEILVQHANAFRIIKADVITRKWFVEIDRFHDESFITLNTLNEHINNFFLNIQLAKMGTITPALIKPIELKSIVKYLNDNIPSFLTLPPLAKKSELFNFYTIVSSKIVTIDENRVAILIKIPLINKKQKYKIIMPTVFSMPLLPNVNSTSKIDIHTNNLFAINYRDQKCFSVNFSVLNSKCVEWEGHYICPKENLDIVIPRKCMCLSTLMRSNYKNFEDCERIFHSANKISEIQFLNRNKYGFSIRGVLTGTMSCPNKNSTFTVSEISLKNVGIFTLPEFCELSFKGQVIKNSLNEFVTANWSISDYLPVETFPPGYLAQSSLWDNLNSLSVLDGNIEDLKNLEKSLENEITFQSNLTLLNRRSKMLLNKTKSLILNESLIKNDKNWVDLPTNHEILLWIGIMLSLIISITLFIRLKILFYKHLLLNVKQTHATYFALREQDRL